eukprot:6391775-Pyramimonas_sp.AAC.1
MVKSALSSLTRQLGPILQLCFNSSRWLDRPTLGRGRCLAVARCPRIGEGPHAVGPQPAVAPI